MNISEAEFFSFFSMKLIALYLELRNCSKARNVPLIITQVKENSYSTHYHNGFFSIIHFESSQVSDLPPNCLNTENFFWANFIDVTNVELNILKVLPCLNSQYCVPLSYLIG